MTNRSRNFLSFFSSFSALRLFLRSDFDCLTFSVFLPEEQGSSLGKVLACCSLMRGVPTGAFGLCRTGCCCLSGWWEAATFTVSFCKTGKLGGGASLLSTLDGTKGSTFCNAFTGGVSITLAGVTLCAALTGGGTTCRVSCVGKGSALPLTLADEGVALTDSRGSIFCMIFAEVGGSIFCMIFAEIGRSTFWAIFVMEETLGKIVAGGFTSICFGTA